MVLVFFFGIVAILVGRFAILGFILAVYTFRPRQLGELLEFLKVLGRDQPPPNTAFVGLALAAALPIVGNNVLSKVASNAATPTVLATAIPPTFNKPEANNEYPNVATANTTLALLR